MNLYAVSVLVALIGTYAVSRWADLRNLRALAQPLPDEFRDVFDEEAYARSQAYTRDKARLGLVGSTLDLVVLLAFWGAGGFGWWDRTVRSIGWGPVPTGLLFIGGLLLARSVLSLPLNVYATFALEGRYGFNRTTPATFVSDHVKGLILALLIGAPMLAGVLAFFEYAGSLAWLYAWVAAVLVSLSLQYVLPTWIMPLFNRFTPLEAGELRKALFAYARQVGFPLTNVFVMDGSRRSSKANAFFTGFGRRKRIALFDTLIAEHTTEQLVAVIAHEVGHYKLRHVLQGLLLSVLHLGVLFAVLAAFLSREGLFQAFGVERPSVYAGLVFFGLLLTPVEFVLGIAFQALSRHNEWAADGFASRTTGDPESMVEALKTLSRNSLSNLTPDPVYVVLNYSHPPVLERIAALRPRGATGRDPRAVL